MRREGGEGKGEKGRGRREGGEMKGEKGRREGRERREG